MRRKQGAYSGIKVVCISICIGRDSPFGAKPPQAGSHKSLMFLSKGKELFYHKGCKFTRVGVDQTRRRPLTVLLFRNCCKRNCISKDNGQFQKAKLRRARRCSRVWSHCSSIPRLLRVTSSQNGFNVSVSSLSSGLQANRRSFAEKKRLLLLRLQNGSAVLHSGIDILRFSICIGRDEPFGAKPRPAIAG